VVWLGFGRTGRSGAALATIFSFNGFVHLLLDSIVGRIWWLAPFVDRPFSLFTVHGTYKPWWLNFMLHWSFALEIALLISAAWLWRGGAATAARTDMRGRKPAPGEEAGGRRSARGA